MLEQGTYDWLRRVVLVSNQKGGAGKSSVVANVAGAAALLNGLKVLVIDADQQGNCSRRNLGVEGDGGVGLAKAIQYGDDLKPLPSGRPGLAVIPGGKALKGAIAAVTGAHIDVPANLGGAIARLCESERYDLILIDSAPGDISILAALLDISRYLIVPTPDDDGSLDGVEELAQEYIAARARGSKIELLGAMLFRVNPRATRINASSAQAVADILEGAAEPFSSTIREAQSVATASRAQGKTVIELVDLVASAKTELLAALRKGETSGGNDLASRRPGPLADDYVRLTNEILGRISEREAKA